MGAKTRLGDFFYILLVIFLLFFIFGGILLPDLFADNPLLKYIFSWDCLADNEFMAVFCNFFFVLKILAIVYVVYTMLHYLKNKI
jgi:hypothetical protein